MPVPDEKNLRKAAIFIIALGPEAGGQVMTCLPESLVEHVTRAIANAGQVPHDEKKQVLSDFITLSSSISGSRAMVGWR